MMVGLICSFTLFFMINKNFELMEKLEEIKNPKDSHIEEIKVLKNCGFVIIFYTFVILVVLSFERFSEEHLSFISILIVSILLVKARYFLKNDSFFELSYMEVLFLIYFWSLYLYYDELESLHLVLDFFFVLLNLCFLSKMIVSFVFSQIKKKKNAGKIRLNKTF